MELAAQSLESQTAMNPTRKLASGIMSALLCVQALLAATAIGAVIIKERPDTSRAAYRTAMAAETVVWR